MQKRILVTGITSIHGYPVFTRCMQNPGFAVMGIRSPKMNLPSGPHVTSQCITDRNALFTIKKAFNPTYIIHCAGVCDLDVCEARPKWAEKLNTDGARAVAEVFGETSHIIFLSSDLVFSGNNPPPGGYAEHHLPDPVSVAGRTILAAEQVFQDLCNPTILRIGLPIGASVMGDKGAIDFIDNRLRKSLPLTLFHDEFRSCISCENIALITELCILQNIKGTYHAGGPTTVSLYDIGRWVLKQGGYTTANYNSISRLEEKNGPPRIGNVALDSSRLLGKLGITLSCPIR